MCGQCSLNPGEVARLDQVVAQFNTDLDKLIEKAVGDLDNGDDGPHVAASVAIVSVVMGSLSVPASLLGFAVLRLAEQRRAATDSGDGESRG